MSYNTIKIKNYSNHVEEFTAAAALYPGMLVEQTPSAATLRKHATSGGNVTCVAFATEDALQGKGITDVYASGSKVQVWYPQPGDIVYALVADEQNIAIGDELESNGAGFLTKHTVKSWGSTDSMVAETLYYSAVVGKVLEALDLSGLSAQGTSDTPLRQFIKMRVRS